MYLDPFIAVYHDLITDAEIAKVKELATPRVGFSLFINGFVKFAIKCHPYNNLVKVSAGFHIYDY